MKRRAFFNLVGLGALATSLPVAIAACTPTTDAPTADAPEATDASAPDAPPADASASTDEFVSVGTVAQLDSEGFLADKDFAAGPLIVIRNPADASSVVAFNSTCNHQGCSVDWKESEFVCPCHGSKFGADGSLENGPATAPLATFEAKEEGGEILVKAA